MVAVRMSQVMHFVPMKEREIRVAANKARAKVTNVRFLKDTSTEAKICRSNSASKKALLIPRVKLSHVILQQLDARMLIES